MSDKHTDDRDIDEILASIDEMLSQKDSFSYKPDNRKDFLEQVAKESEQKLGLSSTITVTEETYEDEPLSDLTSESSPSAQDVAALLNDDTTDLPEETLSDEISEAIEEPTAEDSVPVEGFDETPDERNIFEDDEEEDNTFEDDMDEERTVATPRHRILLTEALLEPSAQEALPLWLEQDDSNESTAPSASEADEKQDTESENRVEPTVPFNDEPLEDPENEDIVETAEAAEIDEADETAEAEQSAAEEESDLDSATDDLDEFDDWEDLEALDALELLEESGEAENIPEDFDSNEEIDEASDQLEAASDKLDDLEESEGFNDSENISEATDITEESDEALDELEAISDALEELDDLEALDDLEELDALEELDDLENTSDELDSSEESEQASEELENKTNQAFENIEDIPETIEEVEDSTTLEEFVASAEEMDELDDLSEALEELDDLSEEMDELNDIVESVEEAAQASNLDDISDAMLSEDDVAAALVAGSTGSFDVTEALGEDTVYKLEAFSSAEEEEPENTELVEAMMEDILGPEDEEQAEAIDEEDPSTEEVDTSDEPEPMSLDEERIESLVDAVSNDIANQLQQQFQMALRNLVRDSIHKHLEDAGFTKPDSSNDTE